MNYRGLNKISLKQAGGSNAESNPRLSSLMKEIESMLNFGSDLSDVVNELMQNGYDESELDEALTLYGYDESAITDAKKSKKQAAELAEVDEANKQAEMRKMAEFQKQYYDSENANSIVSYEDLDNAKRGKETDYLAKPGMYEYIEALKGNPLDSGLTMTELIEGMGPSSTMNQFFDPRYKSYHHPMSYLLPTSQPEKDNPSNLGMALAEGITELFSGKDRDGDGVMDGVFRDSNAKRNRRLAKRDIAKMTPEEMLSNAMQYSQIDFDTERGKYKVDPSLVDPRSISSKNKRVREAYNQSLDDRSGTSLLNFMERIQGNQDNVAAIKDQLMTLPDGRTIGIDEKGAMGVYDDAESNPYYYNTMMGLNQVSPVYGSPTEAPMARQNEYIYSNGIDETLNSLQGQPIGLFNKSASTEQQMDSQMRLDSVEQTPLDENIDPPSSIAITEDDIIRLKEAYPDYFEDESKLTGIDLRKAIHRNSVKAYELMMDGETGRPDGQESEGATGIGFELNEPINSDAYSVDNPNAPTLQNPMGNQPTPEEKKKKDKEIKKLVKEAPPAVREKITTVVTEDDVNEAAKAGVDLVDTSKLTGTKLENAEFENRVRTMDWLQSLTKNNPLLGGDANAMREYLAQMNADADVGLSYRGLGEEAYPNIMRSKTYDDDITNDRLEHVLGPLRYVAAGSGVPRGGTMVNAGQGYGDQTMAGVGPDGIIFDGSKYGMDFNPKWNYNYLNKFADKLQFEEDFANDPLFEYYEGRKLPVKQQRKAGGESLDAYQLGGFDPTSMFQVRQNIDDEVNRQLDDPNFYQNNEKIIDQTFQDPQPYEVYENNMEGPPMLGEPGEDFEQDNLSMKDKIGNFMGNVNDKGNQMIDNFMESDFADNLSKIGTVGVNIANAFEPIAEANRIQDRRNQMRMKRIPGMIADNKDLEGTDINTGLDAQVIAGAQPTGATGYGNFYRTQDNTQIAQYGMELNSEPEDSVMDLSTEMIAKLIAAGADIEIL